MASKEGRPIASILTLTYKGSIVYKYGCSDATFHQASGMAYLLWTTIREAKAAGLSTFDFGRSDLNHQGLIVFKDRLGARKTLLTYYRHTSKTGNQEAAPWESQGLRKMMCRLPAAFLSQASRVLYKHLG